MKKEQGNTSSVSASATVVTARSTIDNNVSAATAIMMRCSIFWV